MKVEIVSSTPDPTGVISRAAGTCYGKDNVDFKRVRNCFRAGHMSVFEHASVTFRIEGISRACSHQLVRHRVASYCLTGDTILRSMRQKSWTIEELYNWQFDKQRKGRLKLIKIRSVDENTNIIVPNKIEAIVDSGICPVYELETESGRKIKCTANHRIYTPEGYKTLEELSVGGFVYANGMELLENPEWLHDYYVVQNHTRKKTAEVVGCCESYLYKALKKYGIKKPHSQYPNRQPGCGRKGSLTEEGRERLRALKIGALNPSYKPDRQRVSTSGGYSEAHRKFDADVCEFCGSAKNVELHHKNKDPKDNRISNIMKLCAKCHKLWHKQGSVGVFSDKIVRIEYVGCERVYDVSMTAPYFNFVANSIVVHNSQQSQRYCKIDTHSCDWYVVPPEIVDKWTRAEFDKCMVDCAQAYQNALDDGIKPEDARYLLPEATKTTIVVTMNCRELFHFFGVRMTKQAQWEIRDLAKAMRDALLEEEGWKDLMSLREEG